MQIDKKHLKASLLFSAVKDVRYYLNGIFFDKRGFIVATDGHRAIAINTGNTFERSFIVPSGLVEKALKVSDKASEFIELDVEFTGTHNAQATVKMDGIKDFAIDGRYPDWEAVIPHNANQGEYVQTPALLNPDYNMDAVKASNIIKGLGNVRYKSPLLFKALRPKNLDDMPWAEACASLNKGCAVHFGDSFTIVVMPTRL
jgi:hypothetical protein